MAIAFFDEHATLRSVTICHSIKTYIRRRTQYNDMMVLSYNTSHLIVFLQRLNVTSCAKEESTIQPEVDWGFKLRNSRIPLNIGFYWLTKAFSFINEYLPLHLANGEPYITWHTEGIAGFGKEMTRALWRLHGVSAIHHERTEGAGKNSSWLSSKRNVLH